MSDNGCPHNPLLSPKTCWECMEEGITEVAKWVRVGAFFLSQYPGTCAANCGFMWGPGEYIQRWDRKSEDGETKYTHSTCRAPVN